MRMATQRKSRVCIGVWVQGNRVHTMVKDTPRDIYDEFKKNHVGSSSLDL